MSNGWRDDRRLAHEVWTTGRLSQSTHPCFAGFHKDTLSEEHWTEIGTTGRPTILWYSFFNYYVFASYSFRSIMYHPYRNSTKIYDTFQCKRICVLAFERKNISEKPTYRVPHKLGRNNLPQGHKVNTTPKCDVDKNCYFSPKCVVGKNCYFFYFLRS